MVVVPPLPEVYSDPVKIIEPDISKEPVREFEFDPTVVEPPLLVTTSDPEDISRLPFILGMMSLFFYIN
jgi:hypothetical protein